MYESIRGRDCILRFKGESQTVVVSQAMVDGGWPGGQGVQWVDSTLDERVVTYSTGLFGGFLIWGSDEDGDKHTGMTRNQPHYRYAVMFSGGNLIQTSSYERYTFASRSGFGPLVPLVYGPNAPLYLSRRGFWTVEDEMTLVGDLMAPCSIAGYVAQVPKLLTKMFLGVQTSM